MLPGSCRDNGAASDGGGVGEHGAREAVEDVASCGVGSAGGGLTAAEARLTAVERKSLDDPLGALDVGFALRPFSLFFLARPDFVR